ncbi:MAG TPA: right-handed parallel beta-helix repeat-containing protein, partial [Candidatus Cloacimonadota bacterium]|nr:right-handed parallel beta-helix repeat-containing protein [Candidatus Cloacimonadota bacterium]
LTVPGTSSQNIVRFESSENHYIANRIIATGTQEKPYLFKIGKVKHIQFKDIAFNNESNEYGNAFYFDSYATHILIENCRITQSVIQSTGYNNNNICFTDKSKIEDISILNSMFTHGTSGIAFQNSVSSDVIITGCEFNLHSTSINAYTVKNLLISNNSINSFTNTGINASHCLNTIIEKNRIIGTGKGIEFVAGTAQSWESGTYYPNLIANNIIKGNNGISVGGNYIDIIHNSIDVKGANSSGFYQYNQSQYLNFFANAVRAEKFAVEIAHPVDSENFSMSGNAYFVDGAYFVKVGSSYYYTINEWTYADSGINAFSIEADPLFTEEAYTTSPLMYSRGVGSSRITDDIDGNIRDMFADIGANEHSPGIPPAFYQAFDKVLSVGPGKEYETLQSCFDDLKRFGFFRWNSEQNHLDTLKIKVDAGIYSGYTTLNHIPRDWNEIEHLGQSWLVIEPANPEDEVIFTYGDENPENKSLLTINGASRFIIRGIQFKNNSIQYNKMISFKGRGKNFEFNSNHFEIAQNLTYSDAIYMENAFYLNSKYKYNQFQNGRYGTYLRTGYYLPESKSVEMSYNTFDGTDYPVNLYNIDQNIFYKNTFTNFYIGIQADQTEGLFNIMNNTFNSDRNSSSGTRALHLGRLNANSEDDRLYVQTNVININNTGIYTSYAAVIDQCNGASISNNNFIMTQSSVLNTSAPLYFTGSASDVRFFNNIVAGFDKSRAIDFNTYSDNYFSQISNNCYYSEATVFSKYNNVIYRSFDRFKEAYPDLVSNSFVAYPFFDESNYAQNNFLRLKGLPPQIGQGHNGLQLYYDLGATAVITDPVEPFSGTIQLESNQGFMSVYEDLMKRGINGPVEIALQNTELNAQFTLRHIPILSENASIKIKSTGNVGYADIRFNADSVQTNFVFKIMGVKNLTLSGLRMESQGEVYSSVMNLHGYNDNLTIDNCILAGQDVPSYSSNKDLALINAVYHFSNHLTLKDNTFYKGSFAMVNEYLNSEVTTSDMISIQNNTFNENSYGVDFQKLNRIDIENNRFHLMKNTAIRLGYTTG